MNNLDITIFNIGCPSDAMGPHMRYSVQVRAMFYKKLLQSTHIFASRRIEE